MVGELVRTLYARGFARDVPAPTADRATRASRSPDAARRFAAQIDYIDHYTDGPETRGSRASGRPRVAVLGEDDVARWCALSLIRNGSAAVGVLPGLDAGRLDAEAAEAAADGCSVDLSELGGALGGAVQGSRCLGATWRRTTSSWSPADRAPPAPVPAAARGHPGGRRRHARPGPTAEHAVMGPLMARGRGAAGPAPRCGSDRAARQQGLAAAADVWSSLALPGAAPAGGRPEGPLAAMLGNMLGYEVFRWTTGALSGRDRRAVDRPGHGVARRHVRAAAAAPALPLCRRRSPRGPGSRGRPSRRPPPWTSPWPVPRPCRCRAWPTAREADELVEELNRRSLLVREHAGVFTRFADEALTQIPLKAGIVELGVGHGRLRRIAAFDVHHVAGARMRALNAAAEVYAEHVVPTDLLPEGEARLAEARTMMSVVEPDALTTASGTGAAPSDVAAWTVATSLITKEQLLVPAAAVRTLTADNAERVFEATTAGTGAGSSLADAAARGLLSALAHDALVRTVRGSAAAPVDPAAVADVETDAEITFLVSSSDQLGLRWELLDLGESRRSGVHVLLARAGGEWAVGSETGRGAAASAALRDLLGRIQLGRERGRGTGGHGRSAAARPGAGNAGHERADRRRGERARTRRLDAGVGEAARRGQGRPGGAHRLRRPGDRGHQHRPRARSPRAPAMVRDAAAAPPGAAAPDAVTDPGAQALAGLLGRSLRRLAGPEAQVARLGVRDEFAAPSVPAAGTAPKAGSSGEADSPVPVHVYGQHAIIGPVPGDVDAARACPRCLARRWQAVRSVSLRDALEIGGETRTAGEWPFATAFAMDAVAALVTAARQRSAGPGGHCLPRGAPARPVHPDGPPLPPRTGPAVPALRYARPRHRGSGTPRTAGRARARAGHLPRTAAGRATTSTVAAFANPVCGALGPSVVHDVSSTSTSATIGVLLDALGRVPAGDVLGRPRRLASRTSARIGVLEGLERYAGMRARAKTTQRHRHTGGVRATGPLDPREVGLYSDEFYRDNPRVRPFTPDREIPWVWGHSLRDGTPRAGARGADVLPRARPGEPLRPGELQRLRVRRLAWRRPSTSG